MENVSPLQDIPSYEDLHSLGPLAALQPPPAADDQVVNDSPPIQYLLTSQQLQQMSS